jgi:GT2 family glycosyltransferase
MDAFRLVRKLLGSVSFWNVRRIWHLTRTQGPVAVWDRALFALGNYDDNRYRELEARPRELARQRRTPLPHQPKISLAVATFNTPLPFLKDLIQSVFDQTYPHWELCIADGASTTPGVISCLNDLVKAHPEKIKLTLLTENRGIAGNQNEALKLCTGDYVGLIDHDDIVLPNALYEMAARLGAERDIDLIYSDEAIADATGAKRISVHLKPDYAPDTLRGSNFICHLTLFRKDLMDALGGLHLGFDGAQDFDLILRATERAKKIAHVPKVLYLWRMHEASTAMSVGAKPYAIDAGRRAIAAHLERLGWPARVEPAVACTYRVRYELKAHPKISILIPSKDQHHLLRNCVASILERSTYPNYEILIVENNSQFVPTFQTYRRLTADSRIRIVRYLDQERFNFSNIVNFGAKHATGEYLLLLNNDAEVISPDWLETMLGFGQRDDVGIVGAKLLFPDNRTQHAGVIVGIHGVAGHIHRGEWREEAGYLGRLCTAQNLSAVTAACMLVRKSLFDELGGFDPRFAVAFNDIDFCLRARQRGPLIVCTPDAVLYHFESITRGYEDTPAKRNRFKKEVAQFQDRWRSFLKQGDPYYNPNLSHLAEDCRLGSPFDGITLAFPFD